MPLPPSQDLAAEGQFVKLFSVCASFTPNLAYGQVMVDYTYFIFNLVQRIVSQGMDGYKIKIKTNNSHILSDIVCAFL